MSDEDLATGLKLRIKRRSIPVFLRVLPFVAEVRRSIGTGPTHQSYLFYQSRSTKLNERKMLSDNSLRRGPVHAPRGARSLGGACEGWSVACSVVPCPQVARVGRDRAQRTQESEARRQLRRLSRPALFRGSFRQSTIPFKQYCKSVPCEKCPLKIVFGGCNLDSRAIYWAISRVSHNPALRRFSRLTHPSNSEFLLCRLVVISYYPPPPPVWATG